MDDVVRRSMATLKTQLDEVRRGVVGAPPQGGAVPSGVDAAAALLAKEEAGRVPTAAAEGVGETVSGEGEGGGSKAEGEARLGSGRLVDAETQIAVLAMRLKQLEGEMAEVKAEHKGERGGERTMPKAAAAEGSDAVRLVQRVEDLQAQLAVLVAQQPLTARIYEVEGLRRALLDFVARDAASRGAPSAVQKVSR